jgi:hypothetical protein
MKKYEFTGETKVEAGTLLRRITALISFGAAVKGDLGGWIEKESNLAQVHGDAWVYGNAQVYGNTQVNGDARVYGNARVHGNAQVYGNAWVHGDARVYGTARVYGDARVSSRLILASRSDGYDFLVTPIADGSTRIIAGCRYFAFKEAAAHWSTARKGTKLGKESLAIVAHLKAMAKIQGWKL